MLYIYIYIYINIYVCIYIYIYIYMYTYEYKWLYMVNVYWRPKDIKFNGRFLYTKLYIILVQLVAFSYMENNHKNVIEMS